MKCAEVALRWRALGKNGYLGRGFGIGSLTLQQHVSCSYQLYLNFFFFFKCVVFSNIIFFKNSHQTHQCVCPKIKTKNKIIIHVASPRPRIASPGGSCGIASTPHVSARECMSQQNFIALFCFYFFFCFFETFFLRFLRSPLLLRSPIPSCSPFFFFFSFSLVSILFLKTFPLLRLCRSPLIRLLHLRSRSSSISNFLRFVTFLHDFEFNQQLIIRLLSAWKCESFCV